jgi:hypothetical protein
MQLSGKVVEIASLEREQKREMFSLMSAYFCNMDEKRFARDLDEKKWAIILSDPACGKIKGFSTLMLIEHYIDGEKIKVLYSGDTIIDRKYWGGNELVKTWGSLVSGLVSENRGVKLFWFLIAMGFRTYRFLPAYFYEYYPSCDKETPLEIKKYMDIFAGMKFGNDYDPSLGLIRRKLDAEYLVRGVSDVTGEKLNNRYIKFFSERNPGYARGDELVCFASLNPGNAKPRLRNILLGQAK